MRSLLVLVVAGIGLVAGAEAASAQSCHEPVRPGDAGWTAGGRSPHVVDGIQKLVEAIVETASDRENEWQAVDAQVRSTRWLVARCMRIQWNW